MTDTSPCNDPWQNLLKRAFKPDADLNIRLDILKILHIEFTKP